MLMLRLLLFTSNLDLYGSLLTVGILGAPPTLSLSVLLVYRQISQWPQLNDWCYVYPLYLYAYNSFWTTQSIDIYRIGSHLLQLSGISESWLATVRFLTFGYIICMHRMNLSSYAFCFLSNNAYWLDFSRSIYTHSRSLLAESCL